MDIENLSNEKELHIFLKTKGFSTNYKKHENASGVDIVAIKDGYCFNIEVKKIVQNKTTKAFKLQDENVVGDIVLCNLDGFGYFPVINSKTSLTKTARFLKMLKCMENKK